MDASARASTSASASTTRDDNQHDETSSLHQVLAPTVRIDGKGGIESPAALVCSKIPQTSTNQTMTTTTTTTTATTARTCTRNRFSVDDGMHVCMKNWCGRTNPSWAGLCIIMCLS